MAEHVELFSKIQHVELLIDELSREFEKITRSTLNQDLHRTVQECDFGRILDCTTHLKKYLDVVTKEGLIEDSRTAQY
jgi:hypothetical protein